MPRTNATARIAAVSAADAINEAGNRVLLATTEGEGTSNSSKKQKKKPSKLRELWWSALPSKVKQLPRGVFCVGLVLQVLLLAVFAVLAGYEYQNNAETTYISPSQDNNNCVKRTKTFSGTYYLGSDGVWDTSTDFDALKASYEVAFTEYSHNEIDWQDTHAPALLSQVRALNSSMKGNPIATNVLALLTKKVSLVDDEMSLTLLSDPAAMLGRTAIAAKLLYNTHSGYKSYAKNCSTLSAGTPSSTLFATSTTLSFSSLITMSFSSSSLSAAGYTSAFTQTSNLQGTSSSTTATITFDLRSAIVAAAVNNGQLGLGDLEKISSVSSTKGLYYLLKYEGMTPITCTTQTSTPVCNVVVGSNEGGMLPLLMHRNNYERMVNSSSTLPRCTCQTSASSCQQWDLMLAMVHYDGCFVTKHDTTPEAYYTGGYNLLAVNLYSLSTYLNDFYLSLPKIHCTGPLSLVGAPEDDSNFLRSAPETLTEDYFVCGYTTFTIWSNTISSAWANTDLVKELLIVVILVVAVFVIKRVYKVDVRFKHNGVDMEDLERLQDRIGRLEAALHVATRGGGKGGAGGSDDATSTTEVFGLGDGLGVLNSALS